MKRAGQIVLFRFPRTDLGEGKLRPALLLGKLPGEYDDWLICMISSQIRHYVPGFDEVVEEDVLDFVFPPIARAGRITGLMRLSKRMFSTLGRAV
jgi:mRNA interferase MazF